MLVPFIREDSDGSFRVGAADPESGYHGPAAEVSADKDWVVIETDAYEGHAMLNVEALPLLIEALRRLQSKLPPPPVSSGRGDGE